MGLGGRLSPDAATVPGIENHAWKPGILDVIIHHWAQSPAPLNWRIGAIVASSACPRGGPAPEVGGRRATRPAPLGDPLGQSSKRRLNWDMLALCCRSREWRSRCSSPAGPSRRRPAQRCRLCAACFHRRCRSTKPQAKLVSQAGSRSPAIRSLRRHRPRRGRRERPRRIARQGGSASVAGPAGWPGVWHRPRGRGPCPTGTRHQKFAGSPLLPAHVAGPAGLSAASGSRPALSTNRLAHGPGALAPTPAAGPVRPAANTCSCERWERWLLLVGPRGRRPWVRTNWGGAPGERPGPEVGMGLK